MEDPIHPIHVKTVSKILRDSGFPSAPTSVLEDITKRINDLNTPLRDRISDLEEQWRMYHCLNR